MVKVSCDYHSDRARSWIGMGFLSAASDSVLSGPLAATVVKYTFGLLSFLVVIFGLVVGMFRFYKNILRNPA